MCKCKETLFLTLNRAPAEDETGKNMERHNSNEFYVHRQTNYHIRDCVPVVEHHQHAVLTNNDFGKRHVLNSEVDIDLLLPKADTNNIGKTLFFRKKGTGKITLTPGEGAVINGLPDLANASKGTGHYINIYVESVNFWAVDNIFGSWEPSAEIDAP